MNFVQTFPWDEVATHPLAQRLKMWIPGDQLTAAVSTIARLESGGTNVAAKNPHSSAAGLFQLLASTRNELGRRYGLAPFRMDQADPVGSFRSQYPYVLAYFNDRLPFLQRWVPAGDAAQVISKDPRLTQISKMYWVWGNGKTNTLLDKGHLVTQGKLAQVAPNLLKAFGANESPIVPAGAMIAAASPLSIPEPENVTPQVPPPQTSSDGGTVPDELLIKTLL